MSKDRCKGCNENKDCAGCEFFFFSTEDIVKALQCNNIEKLTKYLRALGIIEDGCFLNASNADTIDSLIQKAVEDIAFCDNGPTSEETAAELMRLVAPAADVFLFCRYLIASLPKARIVALPSPSKKMINIIKKDKVSDFCKELSSFDEDKYFGILKYLISGDVKSFNRGCTVSVIEYAYSHNLATLQEILTWMTPGIYNQGLNHETDFLIERNKALTSALEEVDIVLKLLNGMLFNDKGEDDDDDNDEKEEEDTE